MAYYEVEIRPMVWRVEGELWGDQCSALVMAKTAAMAANRATARKLFDRIDKVSGPWERKKSDALAIE